MIDRYRRMLEDPVRVCAFERAIETAVRPGDVVIDLGCALGNFTVFACRAGAARVYAVESEPVIDVARRLIAANGCADRVRFLAGSSTELEPPERGHVVIFEDYPITLVAPGALRTVQDAVARWLEPDGTLLPRRARVWIAPAEDASGRVELDRFAAAGERAFGMDLAPTRGLAFGAVYARHLNAAALLCEPVGPLEVDLTALGRPALRLAGEASSLRTGVLHGLLLWFDLELAGDWLSTGPRASPLAWSQAFFPFESPIVLERGTPVRLGLDGGAFGDEMVWRWSVRAGDQSREGGNLEGLAFSPEALQRWDPDAVPELTAELRLERAILEAVDGKRNLEQIARAVRPKLPERFQYDTELQRRILRALEAGRRPRRH